MEKSIARGTLKKGTGGLLREYRDFKTAWREAGRPRHFVWDSQSGGKTISPKLAELHKRRRELLRRHARRRHQAASG